MLVPTIANSIFADTVQGLSDELEPLGYAVILAQSRYDAAREDRMLSALLSRRPEAIIMVGSPATEDGARLLRRAGIPVVETWELPAAPIDAVAGFRQLRRRASPSRGIFSAQGRKRFAFIGGDDPRATRRWNGFTDTLRKAGVKGRAGWCWIATPRAAWRRWRNCPASMRCSPPTTRTRSASCRVCARPAAARRSGSEQPVAVIGLGDLEMGRLIAPSLSTIRVHGDAIGRTAAQLMLSREGPRRIDLGFELVLRDSG